MGQERRGLRTRHWLVVRDSQGLPVRGPWSVVPHRIDIPNTVLVSGAKEEAKLCWDFGSPKPWTKLIISSATPTITRLSTGLSPEDVVKDLANLLVLDNLVSFNVSFDLSEANFTWQRIGIRNEDGTYLLIGSIPSPGFTKQNTQTVTYYSQIEYEA